MSNLEAKGAGKLARRSREVFTCSSWYLWMCLRRGDGGREGGNLNHKSEMSKPSTRNNALDFCFDHTSHSPTLPSLHRHNDSVRSRCALGKGLGRRASFALLPL